MRERHDLHSVGQRQRIEIDAAVVGDAVPAQGGTRAPREFLPRNEIRVVLELGDDDLVTGSEPVREPVVGEGVGDEVERLGGVLGEHHLVDVDPDERRDDSAGVLVRVGRLLRQRMRTAVHGRVPRRQELTLGVEHLHRTLGGGPRVEVDQGFAVAHRAREDREIRLIRAMSKVRTGTVIRSRSLRCCLGETNVAVGLELVGELGATGLDDAATHEDVHELRLDVAQDAGVVGDEQDAAVLVLLVAVHALGDDAQRVHVEARVGLVEDSDLRLQQTELQDLVALLLATGEASLTLRSPKA